MSRKWEVLANETVCCVSGWMKRVPDGRSALDVHMTATVFRRILSDATPRTGRVTANLGTTATAARQVRWGKILHIISEVLSDVMQQ